MTIVTVNPALVFRIGHTEQAASRIIRITHGVAGGVGIGPHPVQCIVTSPIGFTSGVGDDHYPPSRVALQKRRAPQGVNYP